MTRKLKVQVQIVVKCDQDHIVGVWYDKIEEKYPFWCHECDDDLRQGKYPWKLETAIVPRVTE